MRDNVSEQPSAIRDRLLREVVRFVRSAVRVSGIRSVALIGSIVTGRPDPKDVDLLVVVDHDMDLAPLAACARRLQGHTQSFNRGADVFLADEHGRYLGRTCPWKNCGPEFRASCDALRYGVRRYLHDDLRAVRLRNEVIAAPPVQLWPAVERRCTLPGDVERILLELENIG